MELTSTLKTLEIMMWVHTIYQQTIFDTIHSLPLRSIEVLEGVSLNDDGHLAL